MIVKKDFVTCIALPSAVWTTAALSEFLDFWKLLVDLALFGGGSPGTKGLAMKKEYKDNVVLGWYTYRDCWMKYDVDPACMAEPVVGIT